MVKNVVIKQNAAGAIELTGDCGGGLEGQSLIE
jgi:hypothetical protein